MMTNKRNKMTGMNAFMIFLFMMPSKCFLLLYN